MVKKSNCFYIISALSFFLQNLLVAITLFLFSHIFISIKTYTPIRRKQIYYHSRRLCNCPVSRFILTKWPKRHAIYHRFLIYIITFLEHTGITTYKVCPMKKSLNMHNKPITTSQYELLRKKIITKIHIRVHYSVHKNRNQQHL